MEVGGVRRFLSKREGKRNRGRGDHHHHLPHPLSRKEFSTVSPASFTYTDLQPQRCAEACHLCYVEYPMLLSITMYPHQRSRCFFCIRHFLPRLLSRLTYAIIQSSPELAPRAVDPNSAQDFYGLFDAHSPPATAVEEPKVMTLTVGLCLLTNLLM